MLENEYYAIKAVSNSALGLFNTEQGGSPSKFKRWWDGEGDTLNTPSIRNGKLVHKWIEDPKSFIVELENKPSPSIATFIEGIHALTAGEGLDFYTIVFNALQVDKVGTTKDKDKIKTIFTENFFYYEYLEASDGRYMLTLEEKNMLEGCKAAINANHTAHQLLFSDGAFGNESFNEFPIYWTKDGLPLKALLDRVVVDHHNKAIKLIDFKTTGKPVSLFKESFESYAYYRQMAWYYEAILNSDLPKYDIEVYIVVCETKGFECKVFRVSDSYLIKGSFEYQRILFNVEASFESGDFVSYRNEVNGVIELTVNES